MLIKILLNTIQLNAIEKLGLKASDFTFAASISSKSPDRRGNRIDDFFYRMNLIDDQSLWINKDGEYYFMPSQKILKLEEAIALVQKYNHLKNFK